MKSFKKIIFINRFFWPDQSATSRMLSDLAFYLAECGYEVEIICSRQSYVNSKANFVREEIKDKVKIIRVPTTTFGRVNILGRALDYISFYLSSILGLSCRLDKDSIVIPKTDPPLIGVVASAIAYLKGATVIHWCQDLFPEVAFAGSGKSSSRFVSKLLQVLRDWSFREASSVVVLGKDMKEYVESCSGVTPVIISNWAKGSEMKPVLTDRLREEWGLKGKFVLGYSGNLGRTHDYQTILKASEIFREIDDLVILITGGGFAYESLKREVEGRGLPFVFKPYQEQERLAEVLSLPDVHWLTLDERYKDFIFPSKWYGILAAGKPSVFIGDKDSEIARIIDEEKLGVAIPQGDYRKFADAVKELSEDNKRLEEMGKNARDYFEANSDFEIAAEKWEKMLKALTN